MRILADKPCVKTPVKNIICSTYHAMCR